MAERSDHLRRAAAMMLVVAWCAAAAAVAAGADGMGDAENGGFSEFVAAGSPMWVVAGLCLVARAVLTAAHFVVLARSQSPGA